MTAISFCMCLPGSINYKYRTFIFYCNFTFDGVFAILRGISVFTAVLVVSFHNPGSGIDWLVRRFEFINYDGEKEILDKFVPREDVAIVFHFADCPVIVKPPAGYLPRFFVTPLRPAHNVIKVSGVLKTFIAMCKPTVLSALLGLRMILADFPFIQLPKTLFVTLWESLSVCRSEKEEIECFSAFFNDIAAPGYVPDYVDAIYDRIILEGAMASLPRLEEWSGLSERTLQRQFHKRAGVAPKALLRIVRINSLWEKIRGGCVPDYQDLVLEGNYFDQTHFIKDFKSIIGETPDFFFRRDLDVVKILSGKVIN